MSSKYYLKHKRRILDQQARYHAAHREQRLAKMAEYYVDHKEEQAVRMSNYYFKNREKIIARSVENKRHARRNNPNTKVAELLRARMYKAIRGGYKSGSAVRDLGCSIPEFRLHIERQFTGGMTWENMGEWHLDHIKPLASFDLTDRQQFLGAAHWKNYQPLWAKDNFTKEKPRLIRS